MQTFITSDVHFGHKMIIDGDHRSFGSLDDHDQFIVRVWNEKVGPNDEVFILGDVCLCKRERLVEYASQLNGRSKYVVPGNHDSKTLLNGLRDIGWEILDPLVRRHVGALGKVVMCHYPLSTWEYRRQGVFHLHGHTHNPTPLWGPRREKAALGVRVDVGLDAHNLLPWESTELRDFLAEEAREVEALLEQNGENEGVEM